MTKMVVIVADARGDMFFKHRTVKITYSTTSTTPIVIHSQDLTYLPKSILIDFDLPENGIYSLSAAIYHKLTDVPVSVPVKQLILKKEEEKSADLRVIYVKEPSANSLIHLN